MQARGADRGTEGRGGGGGWGGVGGGVGGGVSRNGKALESLFLLFRHQPRHRDDIVRPYILYLIFSTSSAKGKHRE